MSRLVGLTVTTLLALTTAGCGSDSESSSSEPTGATTTEPAVTEPAVTEPGVNEPVVTEPAVTEPATTDGPDSTEPASSELDASPAAGIEVDDDPVCQAFSRLFAASFFQGLAEAFGAEDGAVEKIELFFAPALAPDVVVIRTRGADDFQAFALLARVDAGNAALIAGGFTDDELVELAASGGDAIDSVLAGSEPDLESVGSVVGAESKPAAVAEAFLAEVGTFAEALDANADPAAEAAFLEELGTQCPVLVASFDSL